MCKHRKLAALVWPGVLQLASPQQLGPAQQRGEGARLQHREPPTVQLPMQWRISVNETAKVFLLHSKLKPPLNN